MPPVLTPQDLAEAAARLGVGVDLIRAVDEVESRGSGFDAEGRPRILFEPHVFHRLTKGRYDGEVVIIVSTRWPLSYPRWTPSKYGPECIQHAKLEAAACLDAEAAHAACSWGRYQVLGTHAGGMGYLDALHMAALAQEGEHRHLEFFERFLRIIAPAALRALRVGDLREFVRRYNGPGQVEVYLPRLRKARERYRTAADVPSAATSPPESPAPSQPVADAARTEAPPRLVTPFPPEPLPSP